MTHAETAAGASPSPVSYRQPGVVLTDHTFTVPLNHDDPGGEQITLYARELTAVGKAEADLPWLLYLQGGPGHGGPRPAGRDEWLGRALEEYRVLLMDQRGTGRSTPGEPADARPSRWRAGTGGVPHPLPRRLDRAGRGTGPRRADR